MLAMAIRQSRPFDYEHGGVVNSHDILGQRHDRRTDPMDKVLKYMKDNGLRPTELFRTFDKSVSNKLDSGMFGERLRVCIYRQCTRTCDGTGYSMRRECAHVG